jgi:hypothetical protein
MAETKNPKKQDTKALPKKKYRIQGSDFKFKGKLYAEGKLVWMTEEEFKNESKKTGIEFKEVGNG